MDTPFAHFLDQRYERVVVRFIWEEIGRHRSGRLEHFDQVLRQTTGTTLGHAFGEFSVWNYFTGSRHRDEFYDEGEKYTEIKPAPLETIAKAVVQEDGRVNHMASAYLQIKPRLRPGGLVVAADTPRGSWNRQVALVNADSVLIQPISTGPNSFPTWDRFDDIVLVVTSTEQFGVGYEYTVTAEYDPDLTERVPPSFFAMGQNYPNRFLPLVHGSTTVPFELSSPSVSTTLTIFALDGRRIWRRGPEPLAARTHVWTWGGRNEAGKLVSSGTYYYVLEADGQKARATLALVQK